MGTWLCSIVLFVLTSAEVQASPEPPTNTSQHECLEFHQCKVGLDELRLAVGQGRWQVACGIITPIFKCQKKAIEKCRKEQNGVPKVSLSRLENAQIHTSIKKHSFCDKAKHNDSKEDSKTVRCSEYRQCWETRDKFVHAVRTDQRAKACRYVTPIYECTLAALTDCRSEGTFPEETIKVMDRYNQQAKALMEKHCSYSDQAVQDDQSDIDSNSDKPTKTDEKGKNITKSETTRSSAKVRPVTNPTTTSVPRDGNLERNETILPSTDGTSSDRQDQIVTQKMQKPGNETNSPQSTFGGRPDNKQGRRMRKIQIQDAPGTNSGCAPQSFWLSEAVVMICTMCLYIYVIAL